MILKMFLPLILVIAAPSTVLAGVTLAGAAPPALTLRATCLETTQGEVRFALFDSPDHHLGPAARASAAKVEEAAVGAKRIRTATWLIDQLPHGDYSLAVYHDRNGNGRLDRKIFGLPAEPYGFSNDVRIRFGPPSWKATRFVHDRQGQVIEVCVR